MLWRLTYISTPAKDDVADDLSAILKASREHNAAHGLTGVLLVSRGSYYQTLEGEKGELLKLYERIRLDPRHCDVTTLVDEACDERAFGAWSMAHQGLPDDHAIADQIDVISGGEIPSYRTAASAAHLDILITSFLTA